MQLKDVSKEEAMNIVVGIFPDISKPYLDHLLNDIAEETSIEGVVNILLTNGYNTANEEGNPSTSNEQSGNVLNNEPSPVGQIVASPHLPATPINSGYETDMSSNLSRDSINSLESTVNESEYYAENLSDIFVETDHSLEEEPKKSEPPVLNSVEEQQTLQLPVVLAEPVESREQDSQAVASYSFASMKEQIPEISYNICTSKIIEESQQPSTSVSSALPSLPIIEESQQPSTSVSSAVPSLSDCVYQEYYEHQESTNNHQVTSSIPSQVSTSSMLQQPPEILLSEFPSKDFHNAQNLMTSYWDQFMTITQSESVVRKIQLINKHVLVYNNILEIFPKIQPKYLAYKIMEYALNSSDDTLQLDLINCFLEYGFKRIEVKPVESSKRKQSSSLSGGDEQTDCPEYFTLNTPPSYPCSELLKYLKYVFPDIYANHLSVIVQKSTVRRFGPIYYAIRKLFWDNGIVFTNSRSVPSNKRGLQLVLQHENKKFSLKLKSQSTHYPLPAAQPYTDLYKEFLYCTDNIQTVLEAGDLSALSKAAVNQEVPDPMEIIISGFAPEDMIECCCCFTEAPFEFMAQCSDGHLVCKICLNGYAKEAAFGQAKSTLECIEQECLETYPHSQLVRILNEEILEKLDERRSYDALVCVEDLVRCPRCNYACEIPPENKVMDCPACGFQSCRYCKEDWESHMGRKCDELKKSDAIRKEYEEKMSMVAIRECPTCKSKIVKQDGCNKITCRCGSFMCYICRQKIKDYDHFCRHPLSPNKSCQKCTKCKLHTNTKEDEERHLQQLKEEALTEKKRKGLDAAEVGPSSPKKKKT